MTVRNSGVRCIEGRTDILAVAPHGPCIDGEYQNDLRTGVVVEAIQQQLGCSAVINDRFFKPKGRITKSFADYYLDLFRVDHAAKVDEYMAGIRGVVDAPGKTFVVWVHGIADDKALEQEEEHRALGLLPGEIPLHALIGFGQGGDPKRGDQEENLSARREMVGYVRDSLTEHGMTTLLTHAKCWNYRGRDAKRFNQWFINSGYSHDQVESMTLEITETGFRDTAEHADETATIISSALQALRDRE